LGARCSRWGNGEGFRVFHPVETHRGRRYGAHGATGDGGVDGEWRVSLDVDGVVSDMAAVWEVVGDETARL
jgi:hypothetical protein